MKSIYFLILTPLLFLLGCQNLHIDDFKNTKPRLVIEDYFNGQSEAWGIFEDRFGKIRAQFYVDIDGSWDGKTLTLTENFFYSSGRKDLRIWKINKINENMYEGYADDVLGKAEGKSEGNAFNWNYKMRLPYKDSFIKVSLEDWLFLQEKEVLINKANVRKFGVVIGTISIFFKQKK